MTLFNRRHGQAESGHHWISSTVCPFARITPASEPFAVWRPLVRRNGVPTAPSGCPRRPATGHGVKEAVADVEPAAASERQIVGAEPAT